MSGVLNCRYVTTYAKSQQYDLVYMGGFPIQGAVRFGQGADSVPALPAPGRTDALGGEAV